MTSSEEPDQAPWTVVVAVDDSEGSAIALGWADRLIDQRRSRGLETEAVAVTAWRPPAYDLLGGLGNLDALEEQAEAMLTGVLSRLPEPGRFDGVARLGAPADAILDEADRRGGDLIVLGTRGRGALAELLLGSVSRSVAARSTRPVAIVPPTTGDPGGPVVVGYDGSAGGRAALAWAADHTDAPLRVISAWHLPTDAIYEPGTIDPDRFAAEIAAQLDAAVTDLADTRPDRDLPGRITPVVQRDDPRISLLEASKEASMVVLGARANRGVKGLLLGSTVDYVAARSHQTVVIVPPTEDGGG